MKRQVNKATSRLEFEGVNGIYNSKNNKEYEIEAIWNSAIYIKESRKGHLPCLYYLVSWQGYLKEENTREPVSAMQHLWKLLNIFHKEHPGPINCITNTISSISTWCILIFDLGILRLITSFYTRSFTCCLEHRGECHYNAIEVFNESFIKVCKA